MKDWTYIGWFVTPFEPHGRQGPETKHLNDGGGMCVKALDARSKCVVVPYEIESYFSTLCGLLKRKEK